MKNIDFTDFYNVFYLVQPQQRVLLANNYFAYSTAFVSRITLTLIWPGYSSSDSIFFARSLASRIILSCTGARRGDGVGRLHQAGNDGPRLHVAVMRLDGVDHSRAFLVFPGQLHTQLDVAAFHLVVDRFA